jgi:hypothetical protein
MSMHYIALPRVGGRIRHVAALCTSIEARSHYSQQSEHYCPATIDQPPRQLRPNGWRLAHAAYR